MVVLYLVYSKYRLGYMCSVQSPRTILRSLQSQEADTHNYNSTSIFSAVMFLCIEFLVLCLLPTKDIAPNEVSHEDNKHEEY